MLGPGKLGAYALLFFLTGLVTQLIHILSKPGTMMRTFGVSDDDDDDVEGDDESEEEAAVLSDLHARRRRRSGRRSSRSVAIALVFLFRTQIAQFLLQDPGQADAVVFATITGCVWALFKLAEMVDLVRGPRAHLRADRRRAPDLQPDRDHRHRLGGRRREGGDHRADDRHHARDRDLRRADLEELPGRASRSAS